MPELDHTPDANRRDVRLREDHIGWLATIRPDGRPHLVPIWFYWTGKELIANAEPGSQKIKNMQANPFLSLSLDDTHGGKEPIVLEGRASIGSIADDDAAMSLFYEKYRETMTQMKWPEEEARKTHSVLIRITIDRYVTF